MVIFLLFMPLLLVVTMSHNYLSHLEIATRTNETAQMNRSVDLRAEQRKTHTHSHTSIHITPNAWLNETKQKEIYSFSQSVFLSVADEVIWNVMILSTFGVLHTRTRTWCTYIHSRRRDTIERMGAWVIFYAHNVRQKKFLLNVWNFERTYICACTHTYIRWLCSLHSHTHNIHITPNNKSTRKLTRIFCLPVQMEQKICIANDELPSKRGEMERYCLCATGKCVVVKGNVRR